MLKTVLLNIANKDDTKYCWRACDRLTRASRSIKKEIVKCCVKRIFRDAYVKATHKQQLTLSQHVFSNRCNGKATVEQTDKNIKRQCRSNVRQMTYVW